MTEFVVPENAAGDRIDRVLAGLIPDHSRSALQKLIRDGRVAFDGVPVDSPRQPVVPGAVLTVDFPPEPAAEPAAST